MTMTYRPLYLPLLMLTGLAMLAAPLYAHAAEASQKTGGAATENPAELVRHVSHEVIQALNAHQAKQESNPKFVQHLVKKYLLPHFDFDLTSRLVLGRYWRTATPEQRKAFKKAFLHYLTATYSKGLQHYGGHIKVKVLPFRGDLSKRYVKVRSKIIVPNHSPISVNYALVKRDNGWKLFDFIIEGVSYVRTYQTEFRSEIRHTSLQALINRLHSAKTPSSLTAMKAAVPSTAGGA